MFKVNNKDIQNGVNLFIYLFVYLFIILLSTLKILHIIFFKFYTCK